MYRKEILILAFSVFIGFEKSTAIIKDFLSCTLRQLCETPSFITIEFLFQNLTVLFSFGIYFMRYLVLKTPMDFTKYHLAFLSFCKRNSVPRVSF